MPWRISSGSLRVRTVLVVVCAAALVSATVAPGAASAGSGEDSVAGLRARIQGVTQQRASFGAQVRGDDFLDLSFAGDTFRANAVSGEYKQRGRKLRFGIDPQRLRDFEASWEDAFLAHLEQDGVEPDSVECEVVRAKLRGKVRDGEVKLSSSYRFDCSARGDFGQIDAVVRKRFRGRGPLQVRGSAPSVLSGYAGLMWNFQLIAVAFDSAEQASAGALGLRPLPLLQGSAGAVVSVAPARGAAALVLSQEPSRLLELLQQARAAGLE
jgi:hypothetical protein